MNFKHKDFGKDGYVNYEKQTVTLGDDDNPCWTLAVGHIDAVEFDKRWKEEGWDGALEENPTEEDIKNFQEGLVKAYGKPYGTEEKWGWTWEYEPGEGLIPITIMGW